MRVGHGPTSRASISSGGSGGSRAPFRSVMKQLPTGPLVSVVIPTYRRPEALARCLDSILGNSYQNVEIVVVDDAADDATQAIVRDRSRPNLILLVHEIRTLTAQALNDGITASHGEILVLTGDDNVLDSNAIAGFVESLSVNPQVAFVGALMCYLSSPDLIQTAGAIVTPFTRRMVSIGENVLDRGQYFRPFDVDLVDGCIGVRRATLSVTGMVDSHRLPFYHDTASIQFRARASGLRIVLDPRIRVWHDIPVSQSKTRALLSPLRAYYMIRSRILLERYYDQPLKAASFAVSIPLYLLSFTFRALVTDASAAERWSVFRALMGGLKDGLMMREGIRPF